MGNAGKSRSPFSTFRIFRHVEGKLGAVGDPNTIWTRGRKKALHQPNSHTLFKLRKNKRLTQTQTYTCQHNVEMGT